MGDSRKSLGIRHISLEKKVKFPLRFAGHREFLGHMPLLFDFIQH